MVLFLVFSPMHPTCQIVPATESSKRMGEGGESLSEDSPLNHFHFQ